MTALSRKVLDKTEVALFWSTFEPILLQQGILLVYELKQANAWPNERSKRTTDNTKAGGTDWTLCEGITNHFTIRDHIKYLRRAEL